MQTQALRSFCTWLEHTSMSQTIQTVDWVVPAVQTIHILAIAALMGSALMINLKLVGALGRDQPLAHFSERSVRIIWWALPVLLVTGLIMIIGEPARSLQNPVFQLKMCLVITAIAITLCFQAPLRNNAGFWDATVARRGASLALAILSLALWIGIVFAGRWIAYY